MRPFCYNSSLQKACSRQASANIVESPYFVGLEKTAPAGNVAECPEQSPQLSGQQLVLGEGFHHFVVHHPLDVGQCAVGGASEVKEVAEDVLDALQRHFGVGVWHFAEVEQQIVEGLQDVVAALGVREKLAIFIMFY